MDRCETKTKYLLARPGAARWPALAGVAGELRRWPVRLGGALASQALNTTTPAVSLSTGFIAERKSKFFTPGTGTLPVRCNRTYLCKRVSVCRSLDIADRARKRRMTTRRMRGACKLK